MPRLELFPFRYRDPRTGKWVRARYVAQRHEIAERHPEGWEIIGPAEVRNVDLDVAFFSNLGLSSGSQRPPNGCLACGSRERVLNLRQMPLTLR